MFILTGDDTQIQNNSSIKKEYKKRIPKYKFDENNKLTKTLDQIGILYPMDTFTINLKSDNGRRYLKTTISLELEGEELPLLLDSKIPILRDRIIRILSSKTFDEITSKKGKSKIEEQILEVLNQMINKGNITSIYFTEFVIQ
jgi:flagellar FliL protein